MDKAVEYTQKLDSFVTALNAVKGRADESWQVETGRKFDKVFLQTTHNGKPHQKLGRYMVDRNSWQIFGIKSWAQINPRRTYGTIDTVAQFDWSFHYATPRPGTEAERLHNEVEAKIASGYKKRGRPRKVTP